jgi:hypothetical protein
MMAPVQGVADNKKGDFEVEAQFLSKLHTKMVKFFVKTTIEGRKKKEAQFLKVAVSYCPRPPVNDVPDMTSVGRWQCYYSAADAVTAQLINYITDRGSGWRLTVREVLLI